MKMKSSIKIINLSSKHISLFLIFVSVFFTVFLFYNGPIISPDSTSYINMEIIRGPFYSVFLWIFRTIFGENIYLDFVLLFQIIFNLFTAIVFVLFLKKNINLSPLIVLILYLSLFYPIYKVSIGIKTEALAFPMFLMFIIFYLHYVRNKSYKKYLTSITCLTILILIRTQFLFVFPAIILLELFSKDKVKEKFIRYTLLLLVFFTTMLLDKTYHYLQHGNFISTPFTGIQLATTAFYSSDKDDYILFDGKDRTVVKNVLDSAYDKGLSYNSLLRSHRNVGSSELAWHFTHSYNDLCHRTLRPIIFNSISEENLALKWKKFDNITISFALTLIIDNWQNFSRVFLVNIIENVFKNYFNIFIFLSIFLLLILKFHKNFVNPTYLIILISFLFTSFNLILVSLVEPVMERYTIYTDVLIGISFILLIHSFLQTNFIQSYKS